MMRPLLPVIGALFFCAQSFTALAANSTSTTDTQSVREQVEAKRDQLTGADQLPTATQAEAASLLDAAVVTDDAPAQEQKQP